MVGHLTFLLWTGIILLVPVFGKWCPKVCTCTRDIKGNITKADCSNRHLSHIPRQLPKSLISIDLNGNQIADIPNMTFADLQYLKKLDLSHNHIKRLEPLSYSGLVSLEMLYMRNNQLALYNETYPDTAFFDLRNLRILNIQGNNKDADPKNVYPDRALSVLGKLEELFIDGLENKDFGPGFKLLQNLRVLDLNGYHGYCVLHHISENMFININTKYSLLLNKSGCHISYIHPYVYRTLPSLHTLDLEGNRHLGFENFMNASFGLQNTQIKILNISHILYNISPMVLYAKYFKYLQKTTLTTLALVNNGIFMIEEGAIRSLPQSLKYLSLRDNKILDAHFLLEVVGLGNLEVFDGGLQLHYTVTDVNYLQKKKSSLLVKSVLSNVASFNGSDTMFSCDSQINFSSPEKNLGQKQQYFSNTNLSATRHSGEYASSSNRISSAEVSHVSRGMTSKFKSLRNFPVPLPPNLKVLIMDHIHLGYSIPQLTFLWNKLRYIDASYDMLKCWIGPWHNLPFLEIFNLAGNNCFKVSPYFFKDLVNLRELILKDNLLGASLTNDKQGQTFSTLTELTVLDLGRNMIRGLPVNMFKSQRKLNRLLLNENALQFFIPKIGHMRNLSFIDLSKNNLGSLSEANRHDLDAISKTSNISVSLEDTMLLCSCYTLDFLEWLLVTRVHFHRFNSYNCTFQNGTITSLDSLENIVSTLRLDCVMQTIFVLAMVIFLSVLLILALLASIYYKRWKLRYLYYIGRKRVNPYMPWHEQINLEQIKDVFISYDSDEIIWRQFVQNTLLPKLEVQGITSLISETHSLSGKNIREVIEEAVIGAKKTVALLTNEFFDSYERELEFNMAVMFGMETRQEVVIPVAMEELQLERLPREVKIFLHSNSCLEYREEGDVFWMELVYRIQQ